MNLLIQGGRVIDPSQDLDEVLDILVVNGLVQELGTGLSAPAGAEVIDATGKYVTPGLIDMHAHLTMGPLEITRERGRAVMKALPDDDIAEHNAGRLVAFGVTTVRNPGGDLQAAGRDQARRAAGERVGPESFDAGLVINNTDLPGLATAARTVR